MKNRLESPVVWGVAFGVILAQLQQLSTKSNINGWDIAISGFTVVVAVFGAVNNPTDKNNF